MYLIEGEFGMAVQITAPFMNLGELLIERYLHRLKLACGALRLKHTAEHRYSGTAGEVSMACFPDFMKRPANRIAERAQHTRGIEGYLFDGADGSQMAFWECAVDAVTEAHTHPFDEYFLVVEGVCTLVLDGIEVRVKAPAAEEVSLGPAAALGR